jgi:4-amino-4-deoxy-L-arabinose transferase-like glycosyltransferase
MKTKIFLILIFVLATFLRLVNLGKMPNSYTPDELAQGYTAYSLLTTGKDEWGSNNLLNLRSFGDYKPPLQTLLMIPSVKVFGLTPFAVRFPNAFFSIFTILFTYLLAVQFFKNKNIGLISALFMAVSPWSLPLSRIALEANLVVFIITLATYLFLLGISKKNIFIFSSSIMFFGLSIFTYHSAKVFTPLILITLIFYKKLYQSKIFLSILIIIFSSFVVTQYISTHQRGSNRTNDIAIFNPTDHWQSVSDSQYETRQNGSPNLLTKIFYNKIIYLGEIFSQDYLSYFSPQFLVTNGAGETTYGMIPGFGVLGLIPSFGLLFFLIAFIKGKNRQLLSTHIFLIVVLLISPLAASLAKGEYSGNRVSLMMPFIQIISACGLVYFFDFIPKFFTKITFILISLLFIFFSLVFLQKYFYQGNQILSQGMLYGHQQAIDYIKNQSNIETIIYSRKLSEPQAYVAFFNQIDPKTIQSGSTNWLMYENKKLSFLDQLGEYQLGKYTFKELSFRSDVQIPHAILVGRPEEFLDVLPTYIINYPSKVNPKAAIYIVNTDQYEK